jgi:hypothetical protein
LAQSAAGWLCSTVPATAQLTDVTQTTPSVPGGQIGKSLEEQIGAGHGDVNTPGSAVYLIKRDPARSVRRGRQIFQRKFSANQGFGPRVDFDSEGDIQENRALGAGMVDSCAGCHGRPKGSAGFGGDVVTRPDSRDAPHLFGLGLKEMLADEMTQELRAIRQAALDKAQRLGKPVTRKLRAKRIKFGRITAMPDGSVDTSEVEGVDPDLRIRPFFLQGGTISIREFAIGGFKAEMGLEAFDPVLCAVTDPDTPQAMSSPAGFRYDPSQDTFERPPVCNADFDNDEDGVVNEIDPAIVDHMEFYLLNYFKPGLGKQDDFAEEGSELMEDIGCTECHRRNLTIESDRRVADVETVFDPTQGIFNQLFATAETRFVVVEDGGEFPQLLPAGERFVVKNIFTDFKRHDLGPTFWEREYDGTLNKEFLTTPLWGVGTSAPYGHDGRSISLKQVILRHGGEAQEVTDAFAELDADDQRMVIAFLNTLILFPPDDTASNLNPGNPNDLENVQEPAVHGTINLGALFQIAPEEAE